MGEPMQLIDMKEFCGNVQTWLNDRYGTTEGAESGTRSAHNTINISKKFPITAGKRQVMRSLSMVHF